MNTAVAMTRVHEMVAAFIAIVEREGVTSLAGASMGGS